VIAESTQSRMSQPDPPDGSADSADAVVRVELAALPAHVRTARLICAAVARRAGLADGYVDELKLAVGEACTRAVALHGLHLPHAPVEVGLAWSPTTLTVEVGDRGPAGDATAAPTAGVELLEQLASPDGDGAGLGLALVQGLVDDVSVAPRRGGGTVVSMRWPLPG